MVGTCVYAAPRSLARMGLAAVADLLVAADTQAQVQEAVLFAAAHLLNLEVDLLFFDITSTFFQREARRWARVPSGSMGTPSVVPVRVDARIEGQAAGVMLSWCSWWSTAKTSRAT